MVASVKPALTTHSAPPDLGLGACAWLPLHALGYAQLMECSWGERGGIRDCACKYMR